MTNLEARPREQVCEAGAPADAAAPDGAVELVEPREVPLGGPRAMTVRRTLPHRDRSLVGPFCFLDHYGPDDVAAKGGMDVAPHPHTGLQTVTWLFEGSVLHQDALGSVRTIRPGQLNLMTSGRGISHSEEGTPARFPDQRTLHGVQLWTALPEDRRHGDADFEHLSEVPTLDLDGTRVQVFMGTVGTATSPARAYTPAVAAQLDVPPRTELELPVDPAFEHAVLTDAGDLTVAGTRVEPAWLGYLAPGRTTISLRSGEEPVRAVLIGGTPFPEQILMWWNFVGRTHEEVVAARAEWQRVVAALPGGGAAPDDLDGTTAAAVQRFGTVPGYDGGPLPAPDLPNVRLRPRRR
ncbi:pirin family protein [Georgenia alba]|uniref:Pirin family protein n=1 Tax=Georgenia alba TaxID=2233858 RepID=A0ABW2Q4P3_9MICO